MTGSMRDMALSIRGIGLLAHGVRQHVDEGRVEGLLGLLDQRTKSMFIR